MRDDEVMSVREVGLGPYSVVMTDSDLPEAQTFLLVHGIGMGTSYFAELSLALRPHGRVVAIDLPGFGDSPEPAHSLTMPEMGRLLIDLVGVENLGAVVLVGHSMGTQVAAEAASQCPDLFPQLVLIAPTVNRHERSVPRQAFRLAQDLFNESPKVLALGLQNYYKAGPRWFLKKLRSMMDHQIELTLPSISAHTLVIRGSRDPVCPHGWAEEVAALVPGARLVEIEGRGHETMVKDGFCAADLIADHVSQRC
jgi:pimeloyl-ACP methyl ester carboxylesterase